MNGAYIGKMISPYLERGEFYQGEVAGVGGPSDTPLTFRLADAPLSAAAVCVFLGHGLATPSIDFGEMLLLQQGVHYTVDLPNRKILWRRLAPFALTNDSVLGVYYFTKGLAA